VSSFVDQPYRNAKQGRETWDDVPSQLSALTGHLTWAEMPKKWLDDIPTTGTTPGRLGKPHEARQTQSQAK
jgi:hypothetical protein